jgi:hypothetical protein
MTLTGQQDDMVLPDQERHHDRRPPAAASFAKRQTLNDDLRPDSPFAANP